jgi:RNA polymerase sigma-70 factor (ECF subfamily)
VFQTAASVIKDRFRRRRVRAADRHVVFQPNYHGETEIDPERVVIGQEELAAVAHRIMALPERTRTIFVLRRLEGMSLPEIARQLGLSLSTVEKHIQRAAKQVLSGDEYRS